MTEFFGEAMPGVFKGLDIHFRRNPNQLSLERYSFVPPGGGRFDVPTELLPRCWREKPTGTTDVMGRMRWDFPSHTIRTEFFKPEKGAYLHPQWVPGRQRRGDDSRFLKGDPKLSVNRVVTHYEASLIQDFPSGLPLGRLEDRHREADRERCPFRAGSRDRPSRQAVYLLTCPEFRSGQFSRRATGCLARLSACALHHRLGSFVVGSEGLRPHGDPGIT